MYSQEKSREGHHILENQWYKPVADMMMPLDLGSYGVETKVVRGGTFNPNKSMEKHQVFSLSSEITYYKIPDVGYDKKPFDFFIIEKKYLVLIWQDYRDKVFIIDVQQSQGAIFTRSWEYQELTNQPWCRPI